MICLRSKTINLTLNWPTLFALSMTIKPLIRILSKKQKDLTPASGLDWHILLFAKSDNSPNYFQTVSDLATFQQDYWYKIRPKQAMKIVISYNSKQGIVIFGLLRFQLVKETRGLARWQKEKVDDFGWQYVTCVHDSPWRILE